MTIESSLITISIGIIALAFVALVVFVILSLLSLRQVVKDLDEKVHSFDPLFRVVTKAGIALERKVTKVKQLADEVEESVSEKGIHRQDGAVNTAMEVAEWAMIGLALWQKIKERRSKYVP